MTRRTHFRDIANAYTPKFQAAAIKRVRNREECRQRERTFTSDASVPTREMVDSSAAAEPIATNPSETEVIQEAPLIRDDPGTFTAVNPI
jgi:hypothetical protein